ncbi:MAG: hypothetical protein H8E12_05745 [Rhodobacteraceae bacterium]|nr:hypothetical protein [Paracoccaceae bacterium]
MSNFKTIGADDIQTSTSVLSQLVDVIQEDISGSSTRRKYQVFVTGGLGPGITSSLFQTVYDQDFSLQTSNAVMDMSIGLFESGSTVTACSTGLDANGKLLFPSQSIMMREKVSNYKQYAQVLLGDSDASFYAPGINLYDSAASATGQSTGSKGDRIEEALFVSFKRLFARDEIRKETFALKMFASASLDGSNNDKVAGVVDVTVTNNAYTGSNIFITSTSGSVIYADVGASSTQLKHFGGDVGFIKNTSNTSKTVGLMWYDHGICVLDMGKVFCGDQHMSGTLAAVTNAAPDIFGVGTTLLGFGDHPEVGDTPARGLSSNVSASFIPDFLVSASIDTIVDHIASTRFGSGSFTASTFQNVTNINSTLIFCRATADEFNYSSNPTFRNSAGELVVVDPGDDTGQRTFTFVTTVGLYNSNNELLAVAKLSRPVEKNDEKDLTTRVRLDF